MNSSVHDFYDGEISTPFVTIVDTDASFVMYYAPWDFDCQMVRAEFEHLANQFGSQVIYKPFLNSLTLITLVLIIHSSVW